MPESLAVLGLIGVCLLAPAALAWTVRTRNGLTRRRNLVRESHRQLDVELRRRRELVPQLLETIDTVLSTSPGQFATTGLSPNTGLSAGTGPSMSSGSTRAARLSPAATPLPLALDGARAAFEAARMPGEGSRASSPGEDPLTAALTVLFEAAAQVPALDGREDFTALRGELVETGDQIAAVERLLAAHQAGLTARLGSFPASWVAWGTGLLRRGSAGRTPRGAQTGSADGPEGSGRTAAPSGAASTTGAASTPGTGTASTPGAAPTFDTASTTGRPAQ